MANIAQTDNGVYDLDTIEGCYRYLSREVVMNATQLSCLARLYKAALSTTHPDRSEEEKSVIIKTFLKRL